MARHRRYPVLESPTSNWHNKPIDRSCNAESQQVSQSTRKFLTYSSRYDGESSREKNSWRGQNYRHISDSRNNATNSYAYVAQSNKLYFIPAFHLHLLRKIDAKTCALQDRTISGYHFCSGKDDTSLGYSLVIREYSCGNCLRKFYTLPVGGMGIERWLKKESF